MGREPTREELAKALDTTVDEIDDLTEMGRREPLSLQSPVGEDTELGDLIEEIDSEAGFAEVEDQLLREEIGGAVDKVLDERERHVVALRYGLENGQPLSLRETGKVLGLSGERVRLIEREALRKLRDSNLIDGGGAGRLTPQRLLLPAGPLLPIRARSRRGTPSWAPTVPRG